MHILLFSKASLDISANTLILNATMNYISTKRLEKSLFEYYVIFLLYFHLFKSLNLCIFVIVYMIYIYTKLSSLGTNANVLRLCFQ